MQYDEDSVLLLLLSRENENTVWNRYEIHVFPYLLGYGRISNFPLWVAWGGQAKEKEANAEKSGWASVLSQIGQDKDGAVHGPGHPRAKGLAKISARSTTKSEGPPPKNWYSSFQQAWHWVFRKTFGLISDGAWFYSFSGVRHYFIHLLQYEEGRYSRRGMLLFDCN